MHQGMYGCYIDYKKKLFKKCVSDKINFFRSWRKERISILLEFYFPANRGKLRITDIYLPAWVSVGKSNCLTECVAILGQF